MTDRSEFTAPRESRWLTKAHIPAGKGKTLTIRDCRVEDLKTKDGKVEQKLVIEFREIDQSMTLNRTNCQWLVSTFGPDDDQWIGKRIMVLHEPNIMFGGQRVGGLVIDQAPGPDPTLPVKRAAPKTDPEISDDIPF
jgi:hypothetical protein